MAKDLSKILIIDIEAVFSREIKTASNEIVQVGYCFIDLSDKSISKPKSIFVRPEKIASLPLDMQITTSLTDDEVFTGISFIQACKELSKFKDYTWASWGDYDRRQIERQCQAAGIVFPLGATHINIKNLYSIMNGLPNELSMDKALNAEGMILKGHHHRGDDDAYNIARLFVGILKKDDV